MNPVSQLPTVGVVDESRLFHLQADPADAFLLVRTRQRAPEDDGFRLPAIIKDGKNGYLAKTKEEFIGKMISLIQDAGLRQKMGENACKTIKEDYSLEILGKRLYEVLKHL